MIPDEYKCFGRKFNLSNISKITKVKHCILDRSKSSFTIIFKPGRKKLKLTDFTSDIKSERSYLLHNWQSYQDQKEELKKKGALI